MKEEILMKEQDALNLDNIVSVRYLKKSLGIIPRKAGIYVVFGKYSTIPDFLRKGTGPEFHIKKGEVPQPMNYPVEMLKAKWVEDTGIMYIGKTDKTLHKRISDYIKFGCGKDVAHRGGRAIWQLPDSDNLEIGWKVIDTTASAAAVESDLLRQFKLTHNDLLPFANWRE